jgi:hypothetical protein
LGLAIQLGFGKLARKSAIQLFQIKKMGFPESLKKYFVVVDNGWARMFTF